MTERNIHVDAYIFAKFSQKIFPIITDEAIQIGLSNYFGFTPTQQDVDIFIEKFNAKQAKTSVIKALRSIGFSQFRIAELTGLSQSMVSRYNSNELKHQYEPTNFYFYVRDQYLYRSDKRYEAYHDKYAKMKPVNTLFY